MSSPVDANLTELDLVQNPAIGAFLIWNFGKGFQEDGGDAVPFSLAFLVLPMLLHRQTFEAVAATRKSSGLLLFTAKFEKEREALLELHGRALQLRTLGLQSIGIAATSRLIRIDYSQAAFRAYSLDMLAIKKPRIPARMGGFANAADKVGVWFSKLSISQIASALRIDF